MLRLISVCCILLYPDSFLSGQEPDLDTVQMVTYITDPPIYDGGIDSLKRIIAGNLIYPESAKHDRIEGCVYVNFWIDTTGSTTGHVVVRGVRPI